MEKIPNHKGYHELNAAQKTNLNAVSQYRLTPWDLDRPSLFHVHFE